MLSLLELLLLLLLLLRPLLVPTEVVTVATPSATSEPLTCKEKHSCTHLKTQKFMCLKDSKQLFSEKKHLHKLL